MTRYRGNILKKMIVMPTIAGIIMLLGAVQSPAVLPADLEHPTVTAVRVDFGDYPDPHDELREMVKALVRIGEGDPFSAPLLEKSIHDLKQTGRFEAIHVDSIEKPGQFELVFLLTPYALIKDIRFVNAGPIFESEILRVMTTFIGDVYRPLQLTRQKEAVTQLYRREGFIAPWVEVLAEIDPGDRNCTLRIIVDKGPFVRIENLRISGNQAVSDFTIKRQMASWRRTLAWGTAGRFVEKELREDIKKLDHYYRRRQFAEAKVHKHVHRERNGQGADVTVEIEEGPIYRVEFKGNQAFSERDLTRELTLFTDGNIRGRGERRSIRNIRKRYEAAGFLQAEIKAESELDDVGDQPIRTVHFIIEEGPKTVVKQLLISGNDHLTDKQVEANILTRPRQGLSDGAFSPERLETDVRAVKLQYAKLGFLNADVRSTTRFNTTRDRVTVEIEIEEGVQTRVSGIAFTGLTTVAEGAALESLALQAGEPYAEYLLKNDVNTLRAMIAEKGYPHVNIESTPGISADKKTAHVTFHVEQGPFVRMGNAFYRGNFRTRKQILTREWEIQPGEPFDWDKLLRSQRNIRDTGLFSSVQYRFLGNKEKDDKIDVILELEERKPYFFELSAGYESDRGLFLASGIGDRNLWGMNREGWISGEVSEIGYRIESGLREPRVFGTRATMNFHLFGEQKEEFNQNFGTRTLGASLGFGFDPRTRISTGLNLRYEFRDQYETDADPLPPDEDGTDEFDPRNVLVVTPRLQYDSRDSFVRPKRGIFALFDMDLSAGLDNDLDNFLRYRLDTRYFRTPLKRLTLAFIARGGFIDPYNSVGEVPKDQLFYLGGITDVRGFEENSLLTDATGDPVGGQSFLFGSVEARIGIGTQWELPLFIDVGRIGNVQQPLVEADTRASVGSGLRYITPIGPIGVLYGYKLDRKAGESAGVFHFSLGYTF